MKGFAGADWLIALAAAATMLLAAWGQVDYEHREREREAKYLLWADVA